jgi:hypothetical protein
LYLSILFVPKQVVQRVNGAVLNLSGQHGYDGATVHDADDGVVENKEAGA